MEQAGLMLTCTCCGENVFLKARPAGEIVGFSIYEPKPDGWMRIHREGSIAPESNGGYCTTVKPSFFDLCPECARDFVAKFGKFSEDIPINITPPAQTTAVCAENDEKHKEESAVPYKNDELLCGQNDLIDNSVFDAIQSMAKNEIPWDMELIGTVEEFIEGVLAGYEIPICHPWEDETENICYATADRCKYCDFKEVNTGDS